MNQIELHKKIDEFVLKNPDDVKKEEVLELIPNEDSKQYFFVKADDKWLGWLWDNGFFDVLKRKSEDPTRYGGRRFPELDYLVKSAEKSPRDVVDIMLKDEVATRESNFNPEIVNRFLRICSSLPATELKRMINKIRKDKWVSLMGAFNDWGFEYEKMLKTLVEVNDFDSILILAEAVLSVRPRKEAEKDRGFLSDNPFYFRELSYTKVFDYLLKVDEINTERALALALDIMKKVVLFGEKEGKDEVF